MFPVGDDRRRFETPLVTYSIIAICTAVFFYSLYRGLYWMIDKYGFKPIYLFTGVKLTTLLTCILLHGDPLHLAGNMIYLYAFGRSVEDRLGSLRFTALFLLSGIAGSLVYTASILVLPGQAFLDALTRPLIGASGSISGILGAYTALYPHSRIKTGILVLYYIIFVMIPLKYYLIFWFIYQLLLGVISLRTALPVAIWAHLGGFAIGAAAGYLLKRPSHIMLRASLQR